MRLILDTDIYSDFAEGKPKEAIMARKTLRSPLLQHVERQW
jgi:hypothetical protein